MMRVTPNNKSMVFIVITLTNKFRLISLIDFASIRVMAAVKIWV